MRIIIMYWTATISLHISISCSNVRDVDHNYVNIDYVLNSKACMYAGIGERGEAVQKMSLIGIV